jgi:predicted lipoprotein with Yx(FWY)xxD motif
MKKIRLLIVLAAMLVVAVNVAFATDPDVTIMNKEGIGRYLTDANGRTLYWNKNDSPGKSSCSGPCIEIWIPFYHGAILSALPSAKAKDFGVIDRQDGKKQNTFRGYPLYYYYMDEKPGDTKGQNFKNLWFVIDPEKFHLSEKEYYGYRQTRETSE